MTYAEAAASALALEMAADPTVVVIGEDVGRGGIFGQYKGLQSRFGSERVPASLNHARSFGMKIRRVEADHSRQGLAVREAAIRLHQRIGMASSNFDMIAEHCIVPDL